MDETVGLRTLIGENAHDIITFTTCTIASENGYYDVSPWTLGSVDLATGAMRLLKSTSDITHYVWSPDGTHLAYLVPPAATQLESDLSLVILDADSAAMPRFASNTGLINIQPIWFPDSERLLLAGVTTRDQPLTPFYIATIATGTLEPYIRMPYRAFEWSWSPNRQLVAFAVAGEDLHDIYTFDVTTGSTEVLPAPADYPYVQSLEWSPDGAHIAFRAARKDGDTGLYVMTWNGTRIRRVAEMAHGPGEHLFAWSPDGQRLAFINTVITEDEPPRLQHRLGVVEITGEEPHWLATNLNAEGDEIVLDAPAWSPDGLHLVYSSYQEGGHNLYVVAPDGSAGPRRITHDTNEDASALKYSLAWRPALP